MSIYADIKFNMKDGYPEPILYQSQCGEFRDVAIRHRNIPVPLQRNSTNRTHLIRTTLTSGSFLFYPTDPLIWSTPYRFLQ